MMYPRVLLPALAALPLAIASTELAPVTPITATSIEPRAGITLGQILNPVIGFLECKQGDSTVQLLCRLLSARLHQSMASAGLSIDTNGLLFSYQDGTHIKIDTGHSCTVRAEVTGSQASARLQSSARFDFSGNPLSISDPALFVADLPVELSARIDVKQRFGQRILGSCATLGSDSFHASGALSTRANIGVMFTFAPSPITRDAQGNYVLKIRPITKLAAQLTNTDIKFDLSGVSPLSGLATALLGGTSSIFKAVTNILKGDSLKSVFQNIKQSGIDLIAGAVLATPFDLLDNLVELLARAFIEERQGSVSASFSSEGEKTLRATVARVLQLDANGERTFVLRSDFVDLVSRLGDGADIWLNAPPPGFCTSDAQCSDGKFCNGAERCQNNACVKGTNPCFVGEERCNEASKACISTCGGRTGRMCPRSRNYRAFE